MRVSQQHNTTTGIIETIISCNYKKGKIVIRLTELVAVLVSM